MAKFKVNLSIPVTIAEFKKNKQDTVKKFRRNCSFTYYENKLPYSILKEYSLSKRDKTLNELAPNEEFFEESDDKTFGTIIVKNKENSEVLTKGEPVVAFRCRITHWSINSQEESAEILDKIYAIQRVSPESDDWNKSIIEAFPFLKSKEDDFKTKAFQEELWKTSELLEGVLANGWERVYLITMS